MSRFSKIASYVVLILMAGLFGCTVATLPKTEPGTEDKRREMLYESAYKEGVPFDEKLWQAPEVIYDEELGRVDLNIQGLFYSTYYNGEKTFAFAYLGIPAGATAKDKVPAVVLVHGGGGTAYFEWVREWVKKGYAALAIDTEGNIPHEGGRLNSPVGELRYKSQYPAPSNNNYADSTLDLPQTWMYYAVSTAIAGNSLLHGLDFIDDQKIGMSGVSWGAVITSIVTGYDNRLAFSIPIYGCLNLEGTDGEFGKRLSLNPGALIWDDNGGLLKSKTPVLWVNSNKDSFFPADATTYSFEDSENSQLSLQYGLLHAHDIAVFLPEPYVFADWVCKNQKPLTRFTAQPDNNNTAAKAEFPEGVTLERAYLVYCTDKLLTGAANWERRLITSANGEFSYEVPPNATAFYIEILDSRYLKTSSKLILTDN